MKPFIGLFLFFSISLFCNNVSAQQGKSHNVKQELKKNATKKKKVLFGIASYYAAKFHGRKTANGEVYQNDKLTAACNVLPLNTWIKVTNLRNKKSVIVKINDRMHRKNKRLADLSKAAALKLDFVSRGLIKIKVEVLENYHPPKDSLLN